MQCIKAKIKHERARAYDLTTTSLVINLRMTKIKHTILVHSVNMLRIGPLFESPSGGRENSSGLGKDMVDCGYTQHKSRFKVVKSTDAGLAQEIRESQFGKLKKRYLAPVKGFGG